MAVGRVFISHSHHDEALASRLHNELRRLDVDAFAYQYEMAFGDDLAAEIRRRMRQSDVVLFVLSERARQSLWVSRELGLAHQLQQVDDTRRPIIVGVRSDGDNTAPVFDVVDFETGQSTDMPPYDFAQKRCIDVSRIDLDLQQLKDVLVPKVTYIETGSPDELELLSNSFACYEECFPDMGERDDPADIEEWLEMSRHAAATGSPWVDVYGVLTICGEPIGIAFITVHKERRWCFGNYFGVKRGWRELDRADAFIGNIADKLRAVAPQLRGVVFEIDPIDDALLSAVVSRGGLRAVSQSQEAAVLANLRASRRLSWYASYNALAFLASETEPLPYWQPAMARPLDETNERRLILMAMPIGHRDIGSQDVPEVLDFVFDDLYCDAYGGSGTMAIPGYRHYVGSVKARVLRNIGLQSFAVGPLSMSRSAKFLISEARRSRLLERLNL